MTVLACTLSTALLFCSGCSKHEDIPPMTVKPVTAYGLTLDASASPKKAAYALLRSLRADVEAAQSHDRQAQREAFETTFSLAAYSRIDKRLRAALKPEGKSERDGSGEKNLWREQIYEVINHWAPVVAYYVESFDTDLDRALAKMQSTVGGPNGSEATVLYPVCHDPAATAPDARERVILRIDLVKTPASKGREQFWRVVWVGFRGPAPKHGEPTPQPATLTMPAQTAPSH
jgi:hypothetical protein